MALQMDRNLTPHSSPRAGVPISPDSAPVISSSIAALCEVMCRLAGVKFGGVQNFYGHGPDVCLFAAPISGSTLAVPIDDRMSVARIKEIVKDSAIKFGLENKEK